MVFIRRAFKRNVAGQSPFRRIKNHHYENTEHYLRASTMFESQPAGKKTSVRTKKQKRSIQIEFWAVYVLVHKYIHTQTHNHTYICSMYTKRTRTLFRLDVWIRTKKTAELRVPHTSFTMSENFENSDDKQPNGRSQSFFPLGTHGIMQDQYHDINEVFCLQQFELSNAGFGFWIMLRACGLHSVLVFLMGTNLCLNCTIVSCMCVKCLSNVRLCHVYVSSVSSVRVCHVCVLRNVRIMTKNQSRESNSILSNV